MIKNDVLFYTLGTTAKFFYLFARLVLPHNFSGGFQFLLTNCASHSLC